MARKLATAVFAASMFLPYEKMEGPDYTAEGKARFANDLAEFVIAGFPQHLFTKSLYHRLALAFYHIAHYDQGGFWSSWFADPARCWDWVQYITSNVYVGDPGYTYSDVERAFAQWLMQSLELTNGIRIRAMEFMNAENIALARRVLGALPADFRNSVIAEYMT